jgi:hypothetical protein
VENASNQRCFAGTEVTLQENQVASVQRFGNPISKLEHGLLILDKEFHHVFILTQD